MRRRYFARGTWWTHALMIPLMVVWVYPFVWMASAAFKSESEMFLGGLSVIPHEWTWENFTRAWEVAKFSSYTLNTFIFSAGVVALVLIVSAPAGYALGRGGLPGRKLIVTALVATMFIPHGYTIIPIFKLIATLGLDSSLAGAIVAMAAPAHVVPILLFMGYFAGLPNELEDAARVDGASNLRIFVQIMLPLAKPVLSVVALFNFIGAWNAFFVPLVFTLSNPELRTLGVGMYNFYAIDTTDWTGLAAAAVIGLLPIVAVFLILQRTFVEGIAGAIKS